MSVSLCVCVCWLPNSPERMILMSWNFNECYLYSANHLLENLKYAYSSCTNFFYPSPEWTLKVRSTTTKSDQSMIQKSFFCISCLITYPPFSLKEPIGVFISILEVLNFHSCNQDGDEYRLKLSYISLLESRI